MCAAASAFGLWSVFQIRGPIGDYQIFWISALGVISMAAVGGGVLDWRRQQRFHNASLILALGIVFCAAASVAGVDQLLRRQRVGLAEDNRAVQKLTAEIRDTMKERGVQKPLLAIDASENGLWSIGAGILLQFARTDAPIAVENRLVPLFGMLWSPRGDEDAVFTICGPTLHRELVTRERNFIVAHRAQVFVDGIKANPSAGQRE